MPKEILLMAIDDFHIRFACQNHSKYKKSIHHFHMISQNELVSNGHIQDTDLLKLLISEYLKTVKRKVKQVCIILKSDAILLRHMAFPHVPHKETKDAVLHALKEEFQDGLSNFNFDYIRSAKGLVTIALAPKPLIADYITLCNELRLTLIQVNPFQIRAAQAFRKTTGNLLLVYSSADKLHLLYISEGFLYDSKYVRTLSYESIQTKLNRFTNYYSLHTNLDRVYMISKNIEAVSDYFQNINIPCQLYHESDCIVFD